jgi:hypothetical protein
MGCCEQLPFRRAATVVPSDSTAVTYRKLYVGGTGNVSIDMEVAGSVLLTAVPAGTWIEGHIKKVNEATTATLMVGFW